MKKKLLTGSFLLFFFLFLYLGFRTSLRVFAPESTHTAAVKGENQKLEPLTTETPLPSQGEMILLVLSHQTSPGSSTPEGVWLLSRSGSGGKVNFLPVLPSQAADGRVRDQILRASYSWEGSNGPGEDFFRVLEERNLTWDGVLVLGTADLERLYQEDDSLGSAYPALQDLLYAPENRNSVRRAQAELIAGVCQLIQGQDVTGPVQDLILRLVAEPGLGGTTLSEFSFGESGDEAEGPAEGVSQLECSFPTLDLTTR